MYHFVNNSQFRTLVLDYLANRVRTEGNLVTLSNVSKSGGVNFGVFKIDMGLQGQTKINIKGQWPDGSSIESVYNKDTGNMNYVEGSAREANGTLVPDWTMDVSGPNHGPIGGTHPADNPDAWLNNICQRGAFVEGRCANGTVWSCGETIVAGGVSRVTCVRM